MKSEILVSITGKKEGEWKSKLKEIDELRIKRVALFVESFNKKERSRIYDALLKSSVKSIPFVHARIDMDLEEYKFLIKKFGTKYFNLHIDCFEHLDRLKGIRKKILYEHSFSNTINKHVDLKKIGGLCIDLSHFKSAEERWTNEFEFVISKRKFKRYFIANHLNGFSPSRKKDLHHVRSHKDFAYLRSLPSFVFGRYIAIETYNSIHEQLEFRSYIKGILKEKIKIK